VQRRLLVLHLVSATLYLPSTAVASAVEVMCQPLAAQASSFPGMPALAYKLRLSWQSTQPTQSTQPQSKGSLDWVSTLSVPL
jgi:hypothetical protein